MGMVPGQNLWYQTLEFFVFARSAHDQGRQQLLQHVAVPLEQHLGELLEVVGNEIEIESRLEAQALLGLVRIIQAHYTAHGQHMAASQVVVGVGRREPVEVCA